MRRLSIADPCSASWDRMEGTARERHCTQCDRKVYDLSARTELEATALLLVLGSSGLCVRFSVGDDGAVRHAPRRPPSAHRATGMVAAAALGVAACSPSPPATPAALAPAFQAPLPAVVEAPALPTPTAAPTPVVDADNDGIPDAADACPDVPGVRSDNPHRNGCPTKIGGISQGEIVVLQQVHFVKGSRALDARARKLVEEVAKVLNAYPGIKKIAVSGHVSKDERFAAKLGKARAEAVVDALRKLEVNPARLVVESYGDARPIADNATMVGREKNRRVEFAVLDSANCPAPGTAQTH